METQVLSGINTNKVYKEAAIQIGTFLGGPLVAGYLIATNFKQLGEDEKVKKTWLWACIGFVAYMVMATIIPETVPAIVFNIIAVAITQVIILNFQSAQIKAHIEAGGPLYSTRRAVLIGLGIGLIFLALALGAYFIADAYMLLT